MSSAYKAALRTHIMPTTLQATDWETLLLRTGVIVPSTLFIKVFLQLTKLIVRDKAVSTF
jgi:hypothetical protein